MNATQSANETPYTTTIVNTSNPRHLTNPPDQDQTEFKLKEISLTLQASEQKSNQELSSTNNDSNISEEISNQSDNQQNASSSKSHTKRPPNAFVLFCSDHRPKIKNENPDLTTIDTSQRLAKMWKELSTDESNVYKEKARQLYEKYKQLNPNSKYQKKSHKPIKPKNQPNQLELNSLQVVNHLFQHNPFILQQIIVYKDNKGRFDISKLFFG